MANPTTYLLLSMVLQGAITASELEQPQQEDEKANLDFGLKDTNTGLGMGNITAELYREAVPSNGCGHSQNEDIKWDLISTAITSLRGGADFNLTASQFGPGIYRVVFHTKAYYEERNMSTFYPYVESIIEKAEDANVEITVPLYVSPYNYGSYRGWANKG